MARRTSPRSRIASLHARPIRSTTTDLQRSSRSDGRHRLLARRSGMPSSGLAQRSDLPRTLGENADDRPEVRGTAFRSKEESKPSEARVDPGGRRGKITRRAAIRSIGLFTETPRIR